MVSSLTLFSMLRKNFKRIEAVHVRMKKWLKSYSLIRVEPVSLTPHGSGLLCKVKVTITGKTPISFCGAADRMPKNELVTFENLQAPQILLYEKMLLLTASVSLLWIIFPVAGSVAVKGVLFIQVDW